MSQLGASKLAFTSILFAQALGWIPVARAGDATAQPSASSVPMDPADLATVKRALREFDRFLDHHPLLEDKLRLNPEYAADRDYEDKNPELKSFLEANPNVLRGLKVYPRYFLYRALLREANAPLTYAEIAQLREAFASDPELEPQLRQIPYAIRDPDFQKAHPRLLDFLQRHPHLSHVFTYSSPTT